MEAHLDELRYYIMGGLLEDVNYINGRVRDGKSHFQNVGLKAMATADTEALVSNGCCSKWDSELTIERGLREVYHLIHANV